MRRWRFVFGRFETTTIKIRMSRALQRLMLRVRYIPFPLVCRWITMPSRTPLGAYYIYQRRGYHSVRSHSRAVVGLKRRTGRSQIPRFSFVVIRITFLTCSILGVWRTFVWVYAYIENWFYWYGKNYMYFPYGCRTLDRQSSSHNLHILFSHACTIHYLRLSIQITCMV